MYDEIGGDVHGVCEISGRLSGAETGGSQVRGYFVFVFIFWFLIWLLLLLLYCVK